MTNKFRGNGMQLIRLFFLFIIALGITVESFAQIHTVTKGQSIQNTVKSAKAGDTIKVMPGVYNETVFIDKDNIHLLGVIENGQWPLLDGEETLNDGILVAGHGVTVERMRVKGYKGNGIMTQGGNNFRILRNIVEGPSFYGIFPQFGKNGLVAYNIVSGIEDAAIYAGMCENVDILHNETYGSVMGIETENSHHMLVESNYVHDNSAGIVATLVPGLPIKTASNTIIRNNFIVNNNLDNFAPEGAISANVPAGIGVYVWAVDKVSIESNLIKNNDSVGIMFADHNAFPVAADPKMDPRPDKGQVLGNTFINNGGAPRDVIRGMLLAANRSTGVDLMTTGKGRKNCVSDRASINVFGTERWMDCEPGLTTAQIQTKQLAEPVPSTTLTAKQMGRLTYLAVCTGCHSFTNRIVGPPMLAARAIYNGKPEEMVKWIANPTKRRPDYPAMPPQDYLSEDVLKAVVDYILKDLEQ